jgi:hypothetical protein
MIAAFTRRFRMPSARGTTVALYRPWEHGYYENQYLPGTWTRGTIIRQIPSPTGVRLDIRVDDQDVSFALPETDTPHAYIPFAKGKTTITKTLLVNGQQRLNTLPASYELSLVPRLSEQLAAISDSSIEHIPAVLLRPIGQMLV